MAASGERRPLCTGRFWVSFSEKLNVRRVPLGGTHPPFAPQYVVPLNSGRKRDIPARELAIATHLRESLLRIACRAIVLPGPQKAQASPPREGS
jgi:hypothetical protein